MALVSTAMAIEFDARPVPAGPRPARPVAPARPIAERAPQARRRPVRFPRWLRAVDRVHASNPGSCAVAVDAAVAFAAALLTGASVGWALAWTAATLATVVAARVHAARSCIETQGVLWYLRVLVTPLAIQALGLVALRRGVGDPSLRPFGLLVLTVLLLTAARSATWIVLATARRRGWGRRPTIIVGGGALARTVDAKLRRFPEAGLEPLGILAMDGNWERGEGIGTGALPDDLPALIRRHGIEAVVLVPEGNADVGVSQCLDLCDGLDVEFTLLPPLSDLYLHPGLVTQIGGLPLLPLGRVARTNRTQPGKRLFDVVFASLALVAVAPVMLVTAAAIWLSDRGPIFYRQRRVGRGGRTFSMLKFRSMVVGADRLVLDLRDHNVTDGLLFKMESDPRVTPVGRLIRRLSIDELPQLLNVLKGEMSIVGPRPLPVDPDDFGSLDGKRHSVPPGITGYWQIAGGTGLTYQEMVKLDLSYIQNWSLWLDLRIVLRTVPALLYRHGPA